MQPTASDFRGLFGDRRIVFHAILGSYCAGLAPLCPIEVVACADWGREFAHFGDGIRFLSRERKTSRRLRTHDYDIEAILESVRDELLRLLFGDPSGRWVMVCPYASPALDAFGTATGYPVFTHPVALAEWLNDKSNFFRGLDELGLPRLPGRWVRLTEARYSDLASELGSRFIAQEGRGSGGSGTVWISSLPDFVTAGERFGDVLVWAAPDAGPLSLNINAIALSRSAVAGYPSVQLAGIPELGAGPGAYAGNDYTAIATLPSDVVRGVREQTERIGEWLGSLGYRGLYGLDFVVDMDTSRCFAVDLNPRWQGSTALATQGENFEGRIPLAAAELARRIGLLGEAEVAYLREEFFKPVRGSQMILRQNRAEWLEIAAGVPAGVYSVRDGLTHLRPGATLGDCGPGEVLVTGGVPERGTVVESGAYMARICSQQAALDTERMELVPWARLAVSRLYGVLAPER
ncbi:MAG TPA: hypothetical protein VLE22_23125 [Bryobacteraceae bacterium]|nr:hypothetical protein [Bryobacteraceae bacterium]